MKINFVKLISSFHQGGSESQAVQLLKLLKDHNALNIYPVCIRREGNLLKELRQIGYDNIPEFPLTSFYDLNFIRQLRGFVRFLRQNEIVILETSDFYTNIFGLIAAVFARTPIRIAAKRETGSRSGLQSFFERLMFRFADIIVANSEAVKTQLIRNGIAAGKIETVHNGCEFAELGDNGKSRSEILQRFDLPEDPTLKFVTIVANFHSENKNQRMFLRAAKDISKVSTIARFVLAGEGELLAAHKEFARELGIADKCYFPGPVRDIGELLMISDVCVLCSRFEGFPNSIVEYMAAGKPVVATRVGGVAEAVDDGVSGYLVESDNAGSLCERLLELISDHSKAHKFGETGRKIVGEKFTTEVRRNKMLSIYNQLVKEKFPLSSTGEKKIPHQLI